MCRQGSQHERERRQRPGRLCGGWARWRGGGGIGGGGGGRRIHSARSERHKPACGNYFCMEGKSAAEDMISMSRPSRDNRASKIPKVSSEPPASNPPASKKSQIRAAPGSKKAKTGGEALAGASTIPETGSGSSQKTSRLVSRSKRAAENGGDVTLDALRPVKRRKISEGSSLKSEGENGGVTTAAHAELSTVNYTLRNADSAGNSSEEFNAPAGRSALQQIGSGGKPNGPDLSEAAKVEEERRALRPRPKLTAPKVKKRTRFHEVTVGDEDGPRIVGRRIKVYWPLEKKFFYGHVKAFNAARKLQHKIVYDDKDEEWLRLQNEVFGIELVPGEVFGGSVSSPATEATPADDSVANERNIPGGEDAADATPASGSDKPVEDTNQGRIKPEGVYRRKRKAERSSEEEKKQLDAGASERETKSKEDGIKLAKKGEDGHGATEEEPERGPGEQKKKWDGEKGAFRKKREANKQREASRRANGKRSASGINPGLRERRSKGVVLAGTARSAKETALLSGEASIERSKRAGKDMATRQEGSSSSSIQVRTRNSILAGAKGSRKNLRSRIRDDDRLFPSVKSSIMKHKVAEGKRVKEVKGGSVDLNKSEVKTRGENEKQSSKARLRKRVDFEDARAAPNLQQSVDGGQAPFEAVMDAYREALSGPSTIEENPSTIVRAGLDETSSIGGKGDVGRDVNQDYDGVRSEEISDELVASRPLFADVANGSAFEQAGNEPEGGSMLGGGEFDGQHLGLEIAETEVVPPISPVSRPLRQELKLSPDKVYRRHNPDKVYRRLKHSRNRISNGGVEEHADVPVVPVTRYWVLARALRSTSHVLSQGARMAALGSCFTRFNRTALSGLQCRSCFEDSRLQLGMFYGTPSVQSLLRVSWNLLRWLFASMPVSVNALETVSCRRSRKCELHVTTSYRRVTRPGMIPSRKALRHLSSHLTDPAREWKYLSLSTRYFKGLVVRRPGSAPRRIAIVVGAPRALASGRLFSSSHFAPSPPGQTARHLYTGGRLVVFSQALRRAFSLFDPLISDQKTSAINVLLNRSLEAAAARDWSVETSPVAPPSGGQSRASQRNCSEIGAYYGRRSLRSLLRVTRDQTFKIEAGSLTFTSGWGNVVSVDLRSVLRAIADLHAVAGDTDTLPSVRLTPRESSEGEIFSSLLSRGDVAGGNGSVSTKGLDDPFMGPWFIGAPTNVQPPRSDVIAPRYGGRIPRVIIISDEFLLSTCSPPGLQGAPDLEVTFQSSQVSCKAVTSSDVPEVSQRTLGRNSYTGCREVGAYYGPPCVETLLRVSKDLWMRLLVGGGQPLHKIPATSDVHNNDHSGALPGAQGPELSSIESACDDELSDQEDRMQFTSGEGTLAEELGACVQESSMGGDGFHVPSRSVMSTKRGLRTGKGLKRGFGQIDGDSFVRDGVEGDFYHGSDILNGRPYSKRTRAEIESSGVASNRDSGAETSPQSDLEGKGFATPSLSMQKKPNASSLPRVNVLKLRRCPTNKGLWLVAGNSCVASQDRGMRAEPEGSASLDSHDVAEGGEPMMPIFETSRKRVLDQCLESPQVGRSDHSGNPAVPTNFLNNTVCGPGSQDLDMTASGTTKSTKAFSLNSKSKEVWLDCGIASTNGGVPDGLETRKRRRKGLSPTTADEMDHISEHSVRRSADPGWGSCSVNVLITKSDRCVRETAATVELQPGHGNSCMLTVYIRGETKYALKADQPVASGTTNKFTHSMMWRGGKTWSLEFVDRKQWQVFKDLHEECFQRNVRAASVRHIPIPGVKPIQECPKTGLRFVRPPLKYIHQYDDEVEMALASTRVIYDMDSEDEEWLKQANNEKVSARGTRARPKIDEDTLERVMDKLEKTSFIGQYDIMSSEVASDLCQALGSQDVVRTIHAYWNEKRHRKGMALVRHFQPPPWEQYQTQLQDWQAKVDQLQQQSPTASKQQLQSLCKRPALFAFCLRPRGLEIRNKMQKQRSQRKQGLGGSSSRQWTLAGPPSDFFLDSPSRRHPTFDSASGPFGPKRFVRQRIQEENFSEPMGVDLTESFNSLVGDGFTSLGVAGQGIPHGNRGTFPQVESSSLLGFETSTTGGFKKRSKKVGRKAKRMKLLAAAEESRRKRQQLRALEGHMNGGFVDMLPSPHSLSEISQLPLNAVPSTSGTSFTQVDGDDEDGVAHAKAAEALAKAKRETAVLLRSRAQALYAVADAAMHKAVAAVIAADAIHATERAVEEAAKRKEQEPFRQQTGEACVPGKDDTSQPWARPEASGGVAAFGSWRRALNSASKNANHVLSKGSSSKPGLMTDTEDPLLPVASWSQELGAGLGTRLLQAGEVSPQRQRYSPVLVDGLSKSPAQVRGESLVGLGRTRGESMMAMLTR